MSTSLLAIEVKHERRIRLVFNRPLASGAFTNPTLYTVTAADPLSADPGVAGVLMVPSNLANAELTLAVPMVKGATYIVSAIGVPGGDASVTPAGSTLTVRFGVNAALVNVEPLVKQRDRLVYGVDHLWSGLDFLETASGDLVQSGGTPNVTKALYRRVESNGLPWDRSYGVKAREFVDGPSAAAGTLRGQLGSQLAQDPRVKSVSTKVEFADGSDETYLHAQPILISGEDIKPVSLVVPTDQ